MLGLTGGVALLFAALKDVLPYAWPGLLAHPGQGQLTVVHVSACWSAPLTALHVSVCWPSQVLVAAQSVAEQGLVQVQDCAPPQCLGLPGISSTMPVRVRNDFLLLFVDLLHCVCL